MGIDSSGDVVDTARQALATGAGAPLVITFIVLDAELSAEEAIRTAVTTGVALGGGSDGGGLTQAGRRDLTGGSNGTHTVVDAR